MNSRVVPIIEVTGSPRERGRQQGEGARGQIVSAITRYREILPQAIQMTWENGLREARKFLPYSEYLLGDPNSELYSVETSATTHNIQCGEKGWLVHTNHYLSPKMQALEEPGTCSNSHVRLNRARRLLQGQLGKVSIENQSSAPGSRQLARLHRHARGSESSVPRAWSRPWSRW